MRKKLAMKLKTLVMKKLYIVKNTKQVFNIIKKSETNFLIKGKVEAWYEINGYIEKSSAGVIGQSPAN